MAPPKYSPHIPWLAIVVGGLALLVGVWVLLQLPPAPQPAPRSEPAAVRLTTVEKGERDAALREEIALLDPTPLFLPTEWNTSRAHLATNIQREPAAALQDFPPQLVFRDTNPGIGFPLPVEVPAAATAALAVTTAPGDLLVALGRRDGGIPSALPPRFASLQVVQAADGRLVHADQLTVEGEVPAGDWAPVELLTAVGAGGLIGTPTLTSSSGSEEMDLWLPRYLAKSYRLGERLRPGFYRIWIGP